MEDFDQLRFPYSGQKIRGLLPRTERILVNDFVSLRVCPVWMSLGWKQLGFILFNSPYQVVTW